MPTSVVAVFAEVHIAAVNMQRVSVYDTFRQFFSGFGINCLRRRPGNSHVFGALLLIQKLKINEPYDLIFVQ